MARNDSSRKKPGKKVDSPDRSTSSLTTVNQTTEENQEFPGEILPNEKLPDEKFLSESEKQLILESMFRGGSPAWSCRTLEIPYSRYLRTLEEEDSFHQDVQDAKAALSENITFQLFRSAMEGNVTAQTNFLKLFPPRKWSPPNSDQKSGTDGEDWIENMSDRELFHLAKEMDIHVPEEFLQSAKDS